MSRENENENVRWLTHIPTSDGNFKSRLQTATREEIEEALFIMSRTEEKGNASRIAACARELRRRNKKYEKY